MTYDEDYFERGVQLGISGYTRYRWLPATTLPSCKVMVSHLGLQKGAKVLDYGCAKGFIVKALRILELDACGMDISAYAVGKADKDTKHHVYWIDHQPGAIKSLASSTTWTMTQHPFAPGSATGYNGQSNPHGSLTRTNSNGRFDCTISKDVLEHVPYEKLDGLLAELREVSDMLFVVVPLGENGKYVIPEYELDVTHIIREDRAWWVDKIKNAGFTDIQDTYRIPGIKDNWAHYERGNLFVTAR